jgi:hypothetical protein
MWIVFALDDLGSRIALQRLPAVARCKADGLEHRVRACEKPRRCSLAV